MPDTFWIYVGFLSTYLLEFLGVVFEEDRNEACNVDGVEGVEVNVFMLDDYQRLLVFVEVQRHSTLVDEMIQAGTYAYRKVLSGSITQWHLETEIAEDTELTMELLAAWHMAAAMAYENAIQLYIKEHNKMKSCGDGEINLDPQTSNEIELSSMVNHRHGLTSDEEQPPPWDEQPLESYKNHLSAAKVISSIGASSHYLHGPSLGIFGAASFPSNARLLREHVFETEFKKSLERIKANLSVIAKFTEHRDLDRIAARLGKKLKKSLHQLLDHSDESLCLILDPVVEDKDRKSMSSSSLSPSSKTAAHQDDIQDTCFYTKQSSVDENDVRRLSERFHTANEVILKVQSRTRCDLSHFLQLIGNQEPALQRRLRELEEELSRDTHKGTVTEAAESNTQRSKATKAHLNGILDLADDCTETLQVVAGFSIDYHALVIKRCNQSTTAMATSSDSIRQHIIDAGGDEQVDIPSWIDVPMSATTNEEIKPPEGSSNGMFYFCSAPN